MNTAMPILRRALIYGAWLALAIAVIGSIIGYLVAGGSGVASALVGTVMAAVFLGITSGSILLANRASKSDMFNPAFFVTVMGGWLLKFILFLVIVFLLKDQDWVQPVVLFLSIVAGVIGSLAVDVIVVATSRQPYVDVQLPGDEVRHATED
ncbi:MAG: hypothetical protein JWQ43_3493 [Glaciihabitans sp.]|nr:hypothetical protein [Glaciihabitans sp.]